MKSDFWEEVTGSLGKDGPKSVPEHLAERAFQSAIHSGLPFGRSSLIDVIYRYSWRTAIVAAALAVALFVLPLFTGIIELKDQTALLPKEDDQFLSYGDNLFRATISAGTFFVHPGNETLKGPDKVFDER